MSTCHHLIPSYTSQGFSIARSAIYGVNNFLVKSNFGLRPNDKFQNSCISFMSSTTKFVSVNLSYLSEWLEMPIKLIENIAFTAINLVGAIFNEVCRENLNECKSQLLRDMNVIVVRLPGIFLFPLIPIYFLYNFIINMNKDTEMLEIFEKCNSYRKLIIRKCGINTFSKIITLMSFYTRNLPATKIHADYILQKYISMSKMDLQRLEEHIRKELESFEKNNRPQPENKNPDKQNPPQNNEWKCPQELSVSQSINAPLIKRVLELSHGVVFKLLNASQARVLLCNFMGLQPNASDSEIKGKKKYMNLSLHPDKNEIQIKFQAEAAFNAFRLTFKAAGFN